MIRRGTDVRGPSRESTAPLSAQQVQATIARSSFAVLSHVTAEGAPRSSGVVYAVAAGHLFVAVARTAGRPVTWRRTTGWR